MILWITIRGGNVIKKIVILVSLPSKFSRLFICIGCRVSYMYCRQVEQIELAAEIKTDSKVSSSDWIGFHEALLKELSPQFHPHHYLLMKVKSQLISQYGSAAMPYAKLPTEIVRRKWELCQEFLDVFGAVDPGTHTDWWAMTQLEWIESRVVLLQRDLDSGKIPTVEDFKTALITQCRKTLPDVTSVLELEQTTTYCHQMAKKAKRLMQEMDDIIRFADFL